MAKKKNKPENEQIDEAGIEQKVPEKPVVKESPPAPINPEDLHPDEINALVYADHGAPRRVLGAHGVDDKTLVIRAMRPDASEMYVVKAGDKKRHAMTRVHERGLWQVKLNGSAEPSYHYVVVKADGSEEIAYDPYAYPMLLGEMDRYLLGEGRYRNSWEKMGAHVREIDGVTGVNFAVWAPNARRVSVVGDFNDWNPCVHPMHKHATGGLWEVFVPGIGAGERYKFAVKSEFMDYRAEKSDPYGFYSELRPATASIVWDVNQYEWGDADYMEARREKDMLKEPMSIYEVHLGSWKRKEGNEWLTYRELADQLIPYVKEMNFTHIELMPVAEHPFDGSWGYQVTGYYAPTSRYGTPDDFMYFVDQCHQHGIGVIVDWVPAHFPKDGFALSYFDGTHLYSHEDSRKGEHPDWGTYIFNYGRNEVRNFLISNALFWAKIYHIDGLRVDAVSSMVYLNFSREDGEWIPNQYGGSENLDAVQFLQETNHILYEEMPGVVTIAEESTAWPMVSRPTYLGGLGFTLKWNMGWMHDTIKYMQTDPIFRKYHHNQLTFAMMYAYNENFVLSLSHDEVVHGKGSLIGKMPGDWWQQFAQLRLLWAYQYTSVGKKLNFMGAEFGQWLEWNEYGQLDWGLLTLPTHRGLQSWVRDLNRFYKETPELWLKDYDPDGFRWIEANDADNSIYSYVRFGQNPADHVVVVCNFTPVVREGYRLGVPESGYYREVLNSDSQWYGGGNVGNDGGVNTESISWHDYEQSIEIRVPPFACVIFKKDD